MDIEILSKPQVQLSCTSSIPLSYYLEIGHSLSSESNPLKILRFSLGLVAQLVRVLSPCAMVAGSIPG